MNVPFFRVAISEEEIAEVVDTLRSGWLTTGPKTKRFENEFAENVGAKYAVAVNSCTAALHLALDAIGIKRGDIVFVPALTFTATAEVVRYFDAIPVFVDCDDTLCMNPYAFRNTVETIKEGKPFGGYKQPYGSMKAVIPMHYGGFACDMTQIMNIANEFGLDVIEDAAHTFPAFYRNSPTASWTHTGRFGRVGCFSFYANKCITTGEGGMAVTDDEEIAQRIRLMSLHGMNHDAWNRFTDKGSWYYEIVAAGFKYNLTDVASALGLRQLAHAGDFLKRRESIAMEYNRRFAGSPALTIPPDDPETRVHSWHLYPIRLNLNNLTVDRAQFIEMVKQKGIGCSVHWNPLPLNPYYREALGTVSGMYPNAEAVWPRLVSLPIYPSMTDEEVTYVCDSVLEIAVKVSRT